MSDEMIYFQRSCTNKIKCFKTVLMDHCPEAVGVSIEFLSGLKISYSGDCRPSKDFLNLSQNSDLLIHECTFGDEFKSEAIEKKHSSKSEILKLFKDSNIKHILITHFSQRYPRLPKLPPENTHVIPAFDFMRITSSNIDKCSLMTPMLKMLYPEDSGSENDADGEILTEAQTTLEEPGYFARQNIL